MEVEGSEGCVLNAGSLVSWLFLLIFKCTRLVLVRGGGGKQLIPGYETSLWSAVSLLEVLPKDKKAKEEKTAVLGQACVDLLPLLLTTEQPPPSLKLTVKLLAEGSETSPEKAVSLVCNHHTVQLTQAKVQMLHCTYICVEVYVHNIRAQHVTMQ